VDEDELRQRYEAQKANFRTAEERKARHILIQAADGASEKEVAEARAEAEALLQRINNGEDFSALAKAESQDPGSAKKGGDLGFFGKGIMDKAFEEATFSLAKGAVSGVVQSAFGFHIIKLDDIKGGETKPYEEVAAELKRELQQERAAEIYYDKAEQLANLTYEQPDTLSVAAEQLQLAIKSSDYFARSGGTGISSDPKIATAAFSEDVLVRGNNSATIDLGNNHLVVLRINDHKAESLRPLDEVATEIETALKHNKAKVKTQDEAAALFTRLQAGESPESLAGLLQLEWHMRNGLQRDESKMDRIIVQSAFRMPHPADKGYSSEQFALPSGDQALVMLYAVHAGDLSNISASTRTDAAQRIERAASSAAEQALIAGLRQRAEITTKQ
jgi:peptidyl-prolyl cis-trans isomerase D